MCGVGGRPRVLKKTAQTNKKDQTLFTQEELPSEGDQLLLPPVLPKRPRLKLAHGQRLGVTSRLDGARARDGRRVSWRRNRSLRCILRWGVGGLVAGTLVKNFPLSDVVVSGSIEVYPRRTFVVVRNNDSVAPFQILGNCSAILNWQFVLKVLELVLQAVPKTTARAKSNARNASRGRGAGRSKSRVRSRSDRRARSPPASNTGKGASNKLETKSDLETKGASRAKASIGRPRGRSVGRGGSSAAGVEISDRRGTTSGSKDQLGQDQGQGQGGGRTTTKTVAKDKVEVGSKDQDGSQDQRQGGGREQGPRR